MRANLYAKQTWMHNRCKLGCNIDAIDANLDAIDANLDAILFFLQFGMRLDIDLAAIRQLWTNLRHWRILDFPRRRPNFQTII